ncbi:serine/threonine-protein kinase [Paraglaciecola arctica]|uniref:serine/threonine-protein kinase n=1 Tax=Paraglaciecola arctica TaxID=1128911 RepID=UPI001C06D9B1|nr:serine/threonine-protein kinase [Paraglaciecola arctica]MBU3002317.1 serine/threonine-protein kinase [Paraglaciecola arctica]
MNNDNWPTIEEYFHKALELPVDSRFEFITQEFADEPDIQQAIISLLKHTQETQAISHIVGKATHSIFDSQQDLSGTMAGTYKLIKCIQTGGMGAIYIGERADKQYEKKVAVKLIKSMSTSEYLLVRFREERQILANLEHNNITRLIDGGTTEGGIPFLVMEYVEGIPIDQYCEKHQLTLKQRLNLFVKVCDAIQYAHQNLVVHCDLKPENILVNQDGEPKVMDFGISHLLNKTELSSDAPRLLTIQYASPEQISGSTISVSSDIYSLGAVLYKMLTGSITFPVDATTKEKVLDYISQQQVTLPSEKAGNNPDSYYKSSAQLIDADLDAIVTKAIKAKNNERYSSAADFAEDITRKLEQHPVLARTTSWHHRSYLFFKRNALSSIMGLILCLSVISASAAIWYQSTQVELQRDIAQQERDTALTEQQKAKAVTKFITNMFDSIDPDKTQGNEITVLNVLESATEKLNDPEQSELAQQPMVLAEIRRTIGNIYMYIGRLQASLEQLELANTLYEKYPEQDIEAHISTLNALSNAYSRADRHSDRRIILETIVTQAKEIFGEQDERTIGYTLNLGGYYNNSEQHQKAINTHLKVLESAKKYLGEKSQMTVLALASLGNDYLQFGDVESSISYFNRALSLAKETLGNKHTLVIYILERLVTIHHERDEFAMSKPFTEELVSLTDSMLGPDHQDSHRARFLYAKILNSEKRYSECLAILNQSLQSLPEIIGKTHFHVINTKTFKAKTLSKLSLHDEAILLLLGVIEDITSKYGELDEDTLVKYHILGKFYKASGDLDKAKEVYTSVLQKWQRFTKSSPSDIKDKSQSLYFLYTELSDLDLTSNQPLSAIKFLKQAIEVTEINTEQDYPNLAENIQLLKKLMQQHAPNDSI